MPTTTAAEAIRSVLHLALTSDPKVIVLGEVVGRSGGVAGTCSGLQKAHGDRVIDVPVADRAALGLAFGMALAGRRVVIELAGTGRLPAVLEVLAEAGTVSAGEFPVPLVVRVPYGNEAPGMDAPVGRWLTDLPGVRVVCPSSPAMAAALLRAALAANRPTVILEPRALYAERGEVGEETATDLRVIRAGVSSAGKGPHVTLAAWGPGVDPACAAAEALARDGIEAEVLDLVCLAPLDRAALGARVRATGRLIVVHPNDPALARQVREAALEEAFLHLEAPLGEAPADGGPIEHAARGAVSY